MTLQNKLFCVCGLQQILTLLCTSTGLPSGFNCFSKQTTQNKTGKTRPKLVQQDFIYLFTYFAVGKKFFLLSVVRNCADMGTNIK